MLGANHFRSFFTDGLPALQVAADLANLAAAGMNTLRVYGWGELVRSFLRGRGPALHVATSQPPLPSLPSLVQTETFSMFGMLLPQAPDVREVLRSFHEKTGVRVLFTLPCYKDASQSTVAGLEATTLRYAAEYHNASWLAFYDLCNEPDDQAGYFPAIRLNSSNTTLGDLHPRWKEFYDWQKWLCGGWSTTFDVRPPIPLTSPHDTRTITRCSARRHAHVE